MDVQINRLRIHGFVSGSEVGNFLNIPFASIPARFRQAIPIDPNELSGTVDGTHYGPSQYQPSDPPRIERKHLYAGVESAAWMRGFAEYSSLRLNVYTPPEALKSGARLPVLVYIHGGGWTTGDGHSDMDGNYLVQLSIKAGRPFIYVAINYRLGFYGWLGSKELREEALRNGEKGYNNQGLYDQRLALLWVQKHIHHFGGDGEQVTLVGESAGAWNVLALLLGNVPVCKRAMIQSGCSWRISTSPDPQKRFDDAVASIGVPYTATAQEKLDALRDLNSDQMEALLRGTFVWPNRDPKWFKDYENLEYIEDFVEFPSWVENVVVGYCRDECGTTGIMRGFKSTQEVIDAATPATPIPFFNQEVLSAYGITPDADLATASRGPGQLLTDSEFQVFAYGVAKPRKTPVSLYRFDQVDLEGPFEGYAYHALDNAYFCQMPAVAGPDAPASARATSKALFEATLNLVHGIQPWEEYSEAGRMMVFHGEQSGVVEALDPQRWGTFVETPERRTIFLETLRDGIL